MPKGSNVTTRSAGTRERQDAPPRFEPLRLFLQTWSIPNDTRIPVDELSSAKEANLFRERHMAEHAPARVSNAELATLRALRDDLRKSLRAGETARVEILKPWLEKLPVCVELQSTEPGSGSLRYRHCSRRDAMAGAVLALAVEAVAEGIWRRLKICPDCQSVFYDRTKPENRVWCGMSAHGPGGRACGSIAKVRSWRERRKAAERLGKDATARVPDREGSRRLAADGRV
jgi:predicted RNA-binding Zn ribbon-like protein